MKLAMYIMPLSIALVFAFSAIPAPSGGEEEDLPRWTFMIYLDADNNLESAGIEDMNEMESVGSTDEVNIIVQMDRWETDGDDDDTSNGDWTGAKRFHVIKDSDTGVMNSIELEDLGEVNMGDPYELADFVTWGMDNYPAENYAIVLWDHGGAFWGVCYDDGVPDSDEYDMLNMTDLSLALEMIYLHRGSERIELLGFDACLMAQVAVLYQVQDYVSVTCASGYSEPNDGWPYREILERLVADPGIDSSRLGTIISDEYVDSFSDSEEDPTDSAPVSMAAFDMVKFKEMIHTFDLFSEEMSSIITRTKLKIWYAREECTSYDLLSLAQYDLFGYPMYDVKDFTIELESLLLEILPVYHPLIQLCRDVRKAVDDSIIHVRVATVLPGTDANGLSMYFPNLEDAFTNTIPTEYDQRYEETSFAREHLWDEFLHAYYSWEDVGDSFPVVSISGPELNRSFRMEEEVATIWGTAYDNEYIQRVDIRIDGGEWEEIPGVKGQGKIPWIYPVELIAHGPGPHRVDVRAADTIGDSVPGHTTEAVYTLIYVQESEIVEEGGWSIPPAVWDVLAVLVIITGLMLGLYLFRGRSG